MIPALVLVILLLMALTPGVVPGGRATAHAQQPVENTDHIQSGPYQITVVGGASGMALGTAQYEVTVLSAADAQQVAGAHVVVHTRHSEDGVTGWGTAFSTPDNPGVYRVRLQLGRPGIWEASVEVSSPLGHVESEITPMVVPEAKQYSSGSLVFLGMTLVLLTGLGYVLWTIRRAQRRRSALESAESAESPATPAAPPEDSRES